MAEPGLLHCLRKTARLNTFRSSNLFISAGIIDVDKDPVLDFVVKESKFEVLARYAFILFLGGIMAWAVSSITVSKKIEQVHKEIRTVEVQQRRPGIPGPRGRVGKPGKRGPIGHTGNAGLRGPQGASIRGATGHIGRRGARGLQGPKGPVGPQGSLGHLGPIGPGGPSVDPAEIQAMICQALPLACHP